jgi:hypothetical protein
MQHSNEKSRSKEHFLYKNIKARKQIDWLLDTIRISFLHRKQGCCFIYLVKCLLYIIYIYDIAYFLAQVNVSRWIL